MLIFDDIELNSKLNDQIDPIVHTFLCQFEVSMMQLSSIQRNYEFAVSFKIKNQIKEHHLCMIIVLIAPKWNN